MGFIEECKQSKILIVGNRIKFVGVALGALEGQAERCFPEGIHTVKDTLDAVLFGYDRSFFVDHTVPHEPAGNQLILGVVRQEVACQLLGDELIVWHVSINCMDDPFEINPLVTWLVFLESVGIGLARYIEPGACPLFPKSGMSHEGVN